MDWYPVRKTASWPYWPFDRLDLIESNQVQEWWVIDGNIGPEVMLWVDGKYVDWWPKLTFERASEFAQRMANNG